MLRPRTGLKDMFVELEPGTKRAPLVPEGGMIRIASTAPDIDPDEILSASTATRALPEAADPGGGKGLDGRGDDLRQTLGARAAAPRHGARHASIRQSGAAT